MSEVSLYLGIPVVVRLAPPLPREAQALTVLSVVLTVLKLALTVLTVLYLGLTVLYLGLTVLHVPNSLGGAPGFQSLYISPHRKPRPSV